MSEVTVQREPRFQREPFDAITPRQSRDLAKGLIPAEGFGFLAGPSGTYKTFLAIDWSLRIAEGVPILDHRTTACGVVYVAAEAPNGVRRRVEAWKRENGRRGLPFELIGQAPNIRTRAEVEGLAAELRIAADDFAGRGVRLGLVVIDTLAASMPGGDETAGSDMSSVLSNVSWLAAEVGAFVLIVSHTGKDETRGIRGWSGQFAGADCVVMLSRESQDAGGEIRVGKVAKLKDGEDGQRFAISLKSVSLGFDGDGDEVTSAVIAYDDAPARETKARQKSLNQPAVLTLSAFNRLDDAGRLESVPLAPGVKPGMKGVRVATLRQAVFDLGLKDGEAPADDAPKAERERWFNGRRKAFQRAVEDLGQARKLHAEGGWIWRL